ncbi:hypothetical protein PG996_004650 [Apiospora saccharicola]|uniref:Uncharacterized protein n=1 Tax=Apiospora saccharicola TaxID=335842 RepID=A0ABR1W4S7_9PEZI
MGYYETIGITRTGIPEFVRSHSYHHHHRHRPQREHRYKCFDDCCGIPLAEYNRLADEVRRCQEDVKSLAREKEDLRIAVVDLNNNYKELQKANEWYEAENIRLKADKDRLKLDNDQLRCENAYLRQDLSKEAGQTDAFRRRVKVLDKEVIAQDLVIKDKKAEIRGLKSTNGILSSKLDDYKVRYDQANREIKSRDRDIHKQNETIRDQTNTIRRLQCLLEQYRGW